jgi:hypothetical protein
MAVGQNFPATRANCKLGCASQAVFRSPPDRGTEDGAPINLTIIHKGMRSFLLAYRVASHSVRLSRRSQALAAPPTRTTMTAVATT